MVRLPRTSPAFTGKNVRASPSHGRSATVHRHMLARPAPGLVNAIMLPLRAESRRIGDSVCATCNVKKATGRKSGSVAARARLLRATEEPAEKDEIGEINGIVDD